MQRASPEIAEPSLSQSSEASGARRLGCAVLVLLVAMGAWVKLSDRIAGWAPGLAAPVQLPASSDAKLDGLLELGLTPVAATAAAVQSMQLPAPDDAALTASLRDRRLRLVRLPLFERDGGTGAVVQVDANGLKRVIHLTPEPVVLTIPMAQVGSVTFRLVSGPPLAGGTAPSGVGIGAITLTGPQPLPTLAGGQLLQVGVVAQ